jgi:hypothetical protein
MSDLLVGMRPIEAFPTVDQMLAFTRRVAGDPRVQVREIGRSRGGDPLELVSITVPSAQGRVLVIGQPHPNEPIGMATVVAMVEGLLAQPALLEEYGVDWHFVPCADPDGTRLNEGWFAGPWTREHYARHFYRPAGAQQVEWTFPFRSGDFVVDEPMPETRALMAAIDGIKPTALASLHNGEMGGGYFYVNEGASVPFCESLGRICLSRDVPLHLGDPETPFSELLAPAVFTVPTAGQIHDFVVAAGGDPTSMITGANSGEYAARHGHVTGVAIELPYWRDDRSADSTPDPSGRTLREVVLAGLEQQESMERTLTSLLTAAAPAPSPFREALEGFLGSDDYLEVQRQEAQANPEGERTATVAEVFSITDNVHMFRLRLGGMLVRALTGSPYLERAEQQFALWCAEAAADNKAEAIPIEDLVSIQVEAILATVEESFRHA